MLASPTLSQGQALHDIGLTLNKVTGNVRMDRFRTKRATGDNGEETGCNHCLSNPRKRPELTSIPSQTPNSDPANGPSNRQQQKILLYLKLLVRVHCTGMTTERHSPRSLHSRRANRLNMIGRSIASRSFLLSSYPERGYRASTKNRSTQPPSVPTEFKRSFALKHRCG